MHVSLLPFALLSHVEFMGTYQYSQMVFILFMNYFKLESFSLFWHTNTEAMTEGNSMRLECNRLKRHIFQFLANQLSVYF